MDIHELYQKAGELHGHYCPGLAIGVRAAAEALRILAVEKKVSSQREALLVPELLSVEEHTAAAGRIVPGGALDIRKQLTLARAGWPYEADKLTRPEREAQIFCVPVLVVAAEDFDVSEALLAIRCAGLQQFRQQLRDIQSLQALLFQALRSCALDSVRQRQRMIKVLQRIAPQKVRAGRVPFYQFP